MTFLNSFSFLSSGQKGPPFKYKMRTKYKRKENITMDDFHLYCDTLWNKQQIQKKKG